MCASTMTRQGTVFQISSAAHLSSKIMLVLLVILVASQRIGNAGASSLFQDSFLDRSGGSNEPEFVEEIKNVTVASGREAVISCVVSNLGKYKVGWIRAEDQTILTLDSKVVTHNTRVSVTHDGVQTWNLHIRQVKESDRGCYMCQINTAQMRKQLGCIDVHVSPTIIDEETSADVTVREGDNVTLVCRATGRPPPKITWKREDGSKILVRRGFREVFKGYENISGETLHFVRVDRKSQGAHFCLASNGVPPTKSKRIVLDVNFQPVIKVPSQLLGAPLGSDLILRCEVEAMPKPFVYWVKNRGEMLIDGLGINNSTKYIIEEKRHSYKVEMTLTIKNFTKRDIGVYQCHATNSLGKADGTIRLYEILTTRSTSSSTEKHSVTLQGFATPPMSTDMRNTGLHHHHTNNKEIGTHWKTYEMDSRNPIVSPTDTRSHVNRDDVSSPAITAGGARTTSVMSQNKILVSLFFLFLQLRQYFYGQQFHHHPHHHRHPWMMTSRALLLLPLLLIISLIYLVATSASTVPAPAPSSSVSLSSSSAHNFHKMESQSSELILISSHQQQHHSQDQNHRHQYQPRTTLINSISLPILHFAR